MSTMHLVFFFLSAFGAQGSVAQDANERPLRVVTTLGVLADVTREVGGDAVTVDALAGLGADPHFVSPRPTLMKRVRDADVFIQVGLDLEPWAEVVVAGSGNADIQVGGIGLVVAAQGVTALEVPAQATRALGHVHALGNPHIWLDPVRTIRMGHTIAAGLGRVDEGRKETFVAGAERFQKRIVTSLVGDELVERLGAERIVRLAERNLLREFLTRRDLIDLLGGWMKQMEPLRGKTLVTHHATWSYLAQRFELVANLQLEEKPGIAPTAGHLQTLVGRLEERDAAAILVAGYYPTRAGEWVGSRTDLPVVHCPSDVLADDATVSTYVKLMDRVINELSKAHMNGS